MMKLKEVYDRLQDRNIKVVAEMAEVNYSALNRFAKGETRQPSYEMIVSVIEYLER